MKSLFAAALTILTATSALATSFPNMAQDKGLGIQGLVPEISTFGDAAKVYGAAKFKTEGDASTSYTSVCYFSKDKRQVLVIGANEMHGGGAPQNHKKQIFGDITIKFADVRDLGVCSSTHASFALTNGLALGQLEEKFVKALGEPKASSVSNVEGYQFEIEAGNGFYQNLGVGVSYDTQDRAETISVGQTTSN